MDLAELKQMEDTEKRLREHIKNQQEIINEKDTEIAKIMADKRSVLKTKHVTEYKSAPVSLNKYQIENILEGFKAAVLHYGNGQRYNSSLMRYEDQTIQQLQSLVSTVPLYSAKSEETETVQYINFEDVQRDLRENAEKAVGQELGQLRVKTQDQEAKIAELKQEYTEKLEKLNKESSKALGDLETAKNTEVIQLTQQHREELHKLEKEHADLLDKRNKTIEDLKKQYDDLKYDRDTRSTEQKLQDQISELKALLEKEQKKSWFEKLLGR